MGMLGEGLGEHQTTFGGWDGSVHQLCGFGPFIDDLQSVAHRAGVSPKGALIGPGGARSKAVSDELNGEKIDIVDYSEKLEVYVANALAPAKVISSEVVDIETKAVKVVVPDYQLSLAIGKDGQNARLAARLTGAKIDIHPDNPVERIIKPSKLVEMEQKAQAAREAELAALEAAKLAQIEQELAPEPKAEQGKHLLKRQN